MDGTGKWKNESAVPGFSKTIRNSEICATVSGVIDIAQAVKLYDQRPMPKAYLKEQNLLHVCPSQHGREGTPGTRPGPVSLPETLALQKNQTRPVLPPPTHRSWQSDSNVEFRSHVISYDAESDADNAVCQYLESHNEVSKLDNVNDSMREYWSGFGA